MKKVNYTVKLEKTEKLTEKKIQVKIEKFTELNADEARDVPVKCVNQNPNLFPETIILSFVYMHTKVLYKQIQKQQKVEKYGKSTGRERTMK